MIGGSQAKFGAVRRGFGVSSGVAVGVHDSVIPSEFFPRGCVWSELRVAEPTSHGERPQGRRGWTGRGLGVHCHAGRRGAV